MTRREAKEILKTENEFMCFNPITGYDVEPNDFNKKCYDAHKIAIEAIEYYETIQRVFDLCDFLRDNELWNTQIFYTNNWDGDIMAIIYENNGIIVEYSFEWDYIEIFGLSVTEKQMFEYVRR